ncbi:hypothetical protein ONZ45_g8440 [Pleurotus djamor]|nr:hypothetical protein ONZ45_g8440 [Pleurotus djamor]
MVANAQSHAAARPHQALTLTGSASFMMELDGVAGPLQLGLHSLPPELVYLITNYLRLRDIKEISITCRAYRRTVIPMLFNRIRASDRLTHTSNLSELTSSVWFVKDATRHITLEYFHGIPRFPSNAKHALRAQLRLFPCLTSLNIFLNDARFSLHILRDLRTILQCISKLSFESVKLTLIARRYDTMPTAPRSLPPLPPLKSLAIIWDIEPNLPRPSESYVAAMVDRCKESLRNFTLAINANHFLHTDLSTVIPQLSHVSQLSLLGFGSFSLAMVGLRVDTLVIQLT